MGQGSAIARVSRTLLKAEVAVAGYLSSTGI